jgi:alpha-glucoside transport system substrate-binding protein
MISVQALRFVLVLFTLIALAALAFAACGDDDEEGETPTPAETPAETPTGVDISGESVDVLGIWGDDPELANFRALVAPWEAVTGASMDFTGTRDDVALINTRVEGGNPPDVYLPASLGFFKELQAAGELVPLSECSNIDMAELDAAYGGSLDDFTVDGEVYGFLFKSGNKGTVWYSPTAFTANGYAVPTTYDELVALSDQIVADGNTPWSIAEFANGGTGFPGSDFIQQFLIMESGPDVYDQVATGAIPYSDDQVKAAWEKYGEIALTEGYAVGGSDAILATTFSEGAFPLLADPPEAFLHYMGAFNSGFITTQFPDAVAGEDFDFFAFPSIDPAYAAAVTGDGNIAVMFSSDDATCSFMELLATAQAQEIWAARGGYLSVNKEVSLDVYPNELDRAIAAQLGSADAVFRFDLDDAMPSAAQQAVFQGVQEYIDGGDLDAILQGIEAAYGP